jgi:adenylate cyclase class IV
MINFFGVNTLNIQDTVKLDLNDISKELSFLLYLLRNNANDELLMKQYVSDLDWKMFMKLAIHHRVYPLIYLRLKGMDATLIPTEIMASLQQHYHNNVMKMLHLSREMSRICGVLKDNGIRTLLFKGPILATQLYGDLAHRTSKDLDILVDADDVEKVERVLLQLGYELQDERILGNWKKTSHHLSYEHKQHSAQIEVHW